MEQKIKRGVSNRFVTDSIKSVPSVKPFKVITTPKDDNGVFTSTSYYPVTLGRIFSSTFQKDNTLTAEIRQRVEITSSYPGTQHKNSLNDNPFASLIKVEPQVFTNVQERVMWLDIPSTFSESDVTKHLSSYPEATIYLVRSNEPILTDQDEYAIQSGIITLDTKADSQVVRYPDNHPNAGQICLDHYGQVQYRRACFSSTFKHDEDWRENNSTDAYISAVIANELEESRKQRDLIPVDF